MFNKPTNPVLALVLSVAASSLLASTAYAQFSDSSPCLSTQIGGNVYRDFNADGQRDSGEPGQIAIRAIAYDKGNVVLGSALTDIDGNFKINLAGATPEVRLEFTEIPTHLKSGPTGSGSVTTVAFGAAGNCQFNLGLSSAAQYCQDNPQMAVPCYTGGDPLDTNNYTINSREGKSIVAFDYDAAGSLGSAVLSRLSDNGETGPTWGLAYQRSTKSIFASAFNRRHAGFGPGGTGAIYKIDRRDSSNPVASLFVDLQALGIQTGVDPHTGLTGDAVAPSHDDSSWSQVGKISLGDMDISADEKTIYLTNLFDRKLYQIFIDNPARTPSINDIEGHAIPDPGCGGDFVAFAVKVHDGAVYIGVNCTAENTQNAAELAAYVLKFDGTSFSPVYSFSLADYNKGYGINPAMSPRPSPGYTWSPWARTVLDMFSSFSGFGFVVYPQPIFSNIEFDNDGSMVVSIADRTASQFGPYNYNVTPFETTFVNAPSAGDILRLCQVGSMVWTRENNGICPVPVTLTTAGIGNGQGPGGGEYYHGDNFQLVVGGTTYDAHQEVALGAAVIKPGAASVKLTAFDLFEVEDGGVVTLSNNTGARTSNLQVYTREVGGSFGKSSGLGDLELLCDEAPVQIGNRVWRDLNGNGRQDADDVGIAGVTVNLYDAATNLLVATRVTAANGTYFFGIADGLKTNSNYIIRLDNSADYSGNGPLSGYVLTIPNNANDAIDSDTEDVNGIPTMLVTTGVAGANDHTYDAGFGQLQCIQKDLRNINATIDGNARLMNKLLRDSLKVRRSLAKKYPKQCRKLTTKAETALTKEAQARYIEAWTLSWSYGITTNVCESLLTVCIQDDISSKINTIQNDANILRGIVTQALSGNKCSKTTSTKRKYLKQADTYLATINAEIAKLRALNPLVRCR